MIPHLKSQKPSTRRESSDELDYKDFTRLYKDKITEYILAFIDDITNHLPVNCYGAATRRHDISTIHRRINHEGLSFATLTLPKLWAGLSLYLETGQVHYPSFKSDGNAAHPLFLSGLFRLAYGNSEFKGKAIMLIYQISVMFSKLKGPYPESVLGKQLADFVLVDKSLANLDFTSEPLVPIIDTARNEIENLFKDFDFKDCIPRPGPGATNDPVAKHLRYRPHVLYTQIDDVMPYADYFYVGGFDVCLETKYFLSLYNKRQVAPRARYKQVHKKVGKARGICIEQNEMQFMQQAVKNSLYRYVESHPLTRGKVNFSDQSINAVLALLASIDGEDATIDMSEASDRIARLLVYILFQNTVLIDVLMALSTRYVDFPKISGERADSIELNKYAPMGSGLCFPIMSLIHWALIRAIILHSMQPDEMINRVYVYGDDIIIPSCTVEAVYTYLPMFGMKLNTDKSFYRSKFRESCGVHAYAGVDITPTYVKYVPYSTNITQAMSCIAVESEFYHKGFTNVARVFRENIGKLFPDLPFTPMTSPEFGFKRSGKFEPIRVKPLKARIDAYGEPVYRYRKVCAVQTMDQPPTEYECYLRHVLTRAHARFMGGTPFGFKTKWVYGRLPQLSGHKIQPSLWEYGGYPDIIEDTHLQPTTAQSGKEETKNEYKSKACLLSGVSNRKSRKVSYQGYPNLRATIPVWEYLALPRRGKTVASHTGMGDRNILLSQGRGFASSSRAWTRRFHLCD